MDDDTLKAQATETPTSLDPLCLTSAIMKKPEVPLLPVLGPTQNRRLSILTKLALWHCNNEKDNGCFLQDAFHPNCQVD